MPTISTVVEGHGEVQALSTLIRRIAAIVPPASGLRLTDPIRVPRDRLLRSNELERCVELAARTSGPDGRVLILLDADDDCPRDLAPEILRRARLQAGLVAPAAPESIRNAKGWLSARMPRDRSYSPTRDQSRLTDVFDVDQARRGAPSFDKMWRAVTELL